MGTKERLREMEDSKTCCRCECGLDEDNTDFIDVALIVDGSQGEKYRIPICKECSQMVKAGRFAVPPGMSMAWAEEIKDLKIFDAEFLNQEKKFLKERKKMEQPWREPGRSKRDRRRI
jgi:hypothetical protein